MADSPLSRGVRGCQWTHWGALGELSGPRMVVPVSNSPNAVTAPHCHTEDVEMAWLLRCQENHTRPWVTVQPVTGKDGPWILGVVRPDSAWLRWRPRIVWTGRRATFTSRRTVGPTGSVPWAAGPTPGPPVAPL